MGGGFVGAFTAGIVDLDAVGRLFSAGCCGGTTSVTLCVGAHGMLRRGRREKGWWGVSSLPLPFPLPRSSMPRQLKNNTPKYVVVSLWIR